RLEVSITGARKSPVTVSNEGFTVLQEGQKPIADIIFVHGLQGHPRETWVFTTTTTHAELERGSKPYCCGLFQRKPKSISFNDNVSQINTVYWPEDLLCTDFPNARVLTYGYDSHVSRFFSGPANKNNIYQHGRDLLNSLEAIRRENPNRPIIFVVHSLGGIILKEVSIVYIIRLSINERKNHKNRGEGLSVGSNIRGVLRGELP
ncbi:hypothetical protein K440DRAFT_668537, partial [Wilcoxina mikolae CBS 423.85]